MSTWHCDYSCSSVEDDTPRSVAVCHIHALGVLFDKGVGALAPEICIKSSSVPWGF